ncbi:hypothetical protein ANO14919_045770 [Xylariales sp. No.14919]|nr:hypothetical protein ANO14919_045770 [Xylariales sp. No.14919]
MHLSVVSLFALLISIIHGQNAGFISPAYQHSEDTGTYVGDSRWPLGSTRIVAFSTPWDEYRLEFWQQDLDGGAALSSQFSYTQTAGLAVPQSFQWTVQTYEVQLSRSPIFFFWLQNSLNSSMQQTSAYFNITIDATSSASTSPSSGASLLPTSELSSALAGSATTTSSVLPSTSTTGTPISTTSGMPDVSKELAPGAAAGIGVGATLGVASVAGIIGLAYLRRKRRRTEQQRWPELPGSQPMGYSIGPPEAVVGPTSQHAPKPPRVPSTSDLPLVELAQ